MRHAFCSSKVTVACNRQLSEAKRRMPFMKPAAFRSVQTWGLLAVPVAALAISACRDVGLGTSGGARAADVALASVLGAGPNEPPARQIR